ncbi:hypothetical protein DLJ49_09785 [Rhodovulum sp. 12E13]|uniref:hypothetical protein n=1 Tax=Rhodovulum sp. 12E13 TaxID=2203891 RepID=UPI000E1A5DF7|nr:hypothetical protein [Rhodovulum sp. 12E13]RDC72510.1 hypothetical protein DLJ49_09785 [Rhodovulum sp. 12E13]
MAHVRDTAEQAIREGLTDRDVLRRVFAAHPGANLSTDTIAWYRARLAREGIGTGTRFAEVGDDDLPPAHRPPVDRPPVNRPSASRLAEPATAKGRLITELLRDGLPDYVVYRRSGAVSLATVRAYRSRLIGCGDPVPTEAEACRYWAALNGAAH